MIVINADDWGGWRTATDAALACYTRGRITSASAMVFMADSERGAELAKACGINLGLHLNLDLAFSGRLPPGPLAEYHERVVRFSRRTRYSPLLYNPLLRKQFRYVCEAQLDEFRRLYGQSPSHIDGHHHKHLSLNVLFDGLLPAGTAVRRSFSFLPRDGRWLNRCYSRWIERWLRRRYRLTDYLFSLKECLQKQRLPRVAELAKQASVELETHPEAPDEYAWLQSDACGEMMEDKLVPSSLKC